jgi:sulfate transport system ATP-binding protein
MSIEVRGITKTFGAFAALRDVSIEFPSGELVALLGPSGSGKTTLLRIIAGLEDADAGTILFDGEDATRRHAGDRRVGFVFQHYALFRHMTVFENVAFGLRVKPRAARPPRGEITERVHNLLRLVQLDVQAERYPSQLSGGQRQRVALARALAVEPSVLLLDEPFGALDAKVRKELRLWLRRLHDEIHVTSVFVTHDVEEALQVSDRIVIMNEGGVQQTGSPAQVYEQPATPFVYEFLGGVNVLRGPARAGQGAFRKVYVRPHDVEIARDAGSEALPAGKVLQIRQVGPIVQVDVETDSGDRIAAELGRDRARSLNLTVGDRVFLRFRDPTVFPADYSI